MNKSSVVIYKNLPALVGERDGDKFFVNWCVSRATASGKKAVYASQKVREKDVIPLCESEASSIDALLDFSETSCAENSEVKNQIAETHELLLSDDETATAELSFSDIAGLLRGELKANESWGLYSALKSSFESFGVKDYSLKINIRFINICFFYIIIRYKVFLLIYF